MAKHASFELEGPTDQNVCFLQRRKYLPLQIRWLFHLLVLIIDNGWN